MSCKAVDGSKPWIYRLEFSKGFGLAQEKRNKTRFHDLSLGVMGCETLIFRPRAPVGWEHAWRGQHGNNTEKTPSEHGQTSFQPGSDFDLLGSQHTQKFLWLDLDWKT